MRSCSRFCDLLPDLPKARMVSPLAALTVLCLLSSCASGPAGYGGSTHYLPGVRSGNNEFGLGPSPQMTSNFMLNDTVSYWDGEGIPGSPAVVISLSQQRAYFYKGNQLVGVSLISTGTDQYETPTGDFKIIQKNKDHESNLYGDYKYPDGTIAMKDIDTSKDPQPPGTVYDGADMPYFMRFTGGVGMHGGFLPGFPASHGCVRMPEPMAKIYFENVSNGTPVRVVH